MKQKRKKTVSEMTVFDDIRGLLTPTQVPDSRAYKNARLIDINLIQPNPSQPRTAINMKSLAELAQSIKDTDLLQPIVVRQAGDIYHIIAGHRRFQAWKMVTDKPIPCIVRLSDELQALEQSLIENIQREKLDEVDEARYFRRLMDQLGYTMEQLAQRIHKSLGYVDSRLKLLRYEDIAIAVKEGTLGIFDARELAKVDDAAPRADLLRKVVEGQLDRVSLKQEVRQITSKDFQQLKMAQLEKLRRDISTLDLHSFAEATQQKARSLLLDMHQFLSKLLSQE